MSERLQRAVNAFHSTRRADEHYGCDLDEREPDPTHTCPFEHYGSPMVNLMLPGSRAKDATWENLMRQRHAAIVAVISNPGKRAQIPIPPEGTGYIASMKPFNADSRPVQLNQVAIKRRGFA